jgi:hypothetical protein
MTNAGQHPPTVDSAPSASNMPGGLNVTSSFRLGLWGTAGAGKTTYLTMLYEALADDPQITVVADRSAREFAEVYRGDIKERGQFPSATLRHATLDMLHYSIYPEPEHSEDRRKPFKLSFIDAPGGYYENLDGNDTVQSQMTILDFLSNCHGIIFLLDPERIEGPDAHNYRRLLDTLMQHMVDRTLQNGHGPRPEQYMAFCVTKIDEEKWWQDHDKPDLLVERIIGQDMFRQLSTQYCQKERYKCFALSAIGRRRDPNNSSSSLPNVETIAPTAGPQQPGVPPAAARRPAIVQPIVSRPQAIPPPTPPSGDGLDAVFRSQGRDEPPANLNTNTKRIIQPGEAIKPVGLIEPIHWLIAQIHIRPPDISPRG